MKKNLRNQFKWMLLGLYFMVIIILMISGYFKLNSLTTITALNVCGIPIFCLSLYLFSGKNPTRLLKEFKKH